jgi:hypothetical protein
MSLFEDGLDPTHLVLAGVAAALLLVLIWSVFRRRDAKLPLRRLLGRIVTEPGPVGLYLRGMFVPAGEFYSRSPEYPPSPTSGVTVHKWTGIPEVVSAADLRATADVLRLLVAANADIDLAHRSVEKDRRVWDTPAVSIGCHFTSQQLLEGCEPRLVAFRNPDAFRSLGSHEVFEARGGTEYGLIYKGAHAATHRSYWVIMGLGEVGTEGAAAWLRANAATLVRLTGRAPFGAILAVETAKGPQSAVLRSLQPKPSWWRRLLFRRELERLMGLAPAHAPRGP